MNALPDFPTDQGQRDLVQWAEQVLRSDEEHFLIPYQLETSLSKLFVSLVFVGQITFPHIVSTAVDEMTDNPLSPYGQADLSYFLNLPFSIIGGVASAIGSIGAISLWWRRRHGRMWLVTNLFLPGLERSLYALLYAFIRAYFTGTGNFSVHDQITMIILAVSVLFCASAAFVYYNVNKKRRRAQ
ncbi:hypothetical protein BD410DRAFT_842763 [Rickenella mellea]|uniref:Uncharacterized protein n=1 Tax=Rickenella mellea TaxID=50990 RepID=A0A4Y7PU35_9AGAM|nr:hypothetical protein BD410DRAFT_842763 [Rickenella mellea]